MNRLSTPQLASSHQILSVQNHRCTDVQYLRRWIMVLSFVIGVVFPFGASSPAAAQVAAGTFIVDTVADAPDAVVGDGACRTATNVCSLRAALQEANIRSGADEIKFNIPGPGLKTIKLTDHLPPISDRSGGITIDGYSQGGAAPNTDPATSNARILIEIQGNGVGAFEPEGEGAFRGFRISSGNNIIKGVALFSIFRPIIISGPSATNNQIAGNFIGTNAAGTFVTRPLISKSDGVVLQLGASRNVVGGVLPWQRNVIVGNPWRGIQLIDAGTQYNEIKGNIVGLAPTGNVIAFASDGTPIGNGLHNVDLQFGASDNIVGGLEPGARNIISVAGEAGVEVSHSTTTQRNIIIGNCIGTGVNCQSARPNGTFGVRVKDGVTDTIISNNVIAHNRQGGVDIQWRADYRPTVNTVVRQNTITSNGLSGEYEELAHFGVSGQRAYGLRIEGNVITGNGVNGVLVDDVNRDAQTSVTIVQNRISGHSGLGIERNAPQGPNADMPVLTRATPQRITGYTCASCVVEVFRAAPSPGESFGEGDVFLAAGTADANGFFVIDVANVSVGQYVTATRTTPNGETSEFSRNRKVTPVDFTVFVPQTIR